MSSATLEEVEVIDSAPNQLRAVEQLPPDLMLLKMENESMMSVARTQPRDSMKIVKQLAELIEAYPAAADEAIYCKPVGTVTQLTCVDCGIKYEVPKVDNETVCPNCESKRKKDGRSVKKFAEGLSIRAAESIRSIFGCTRLAVTCEILENGSAKLVGTLVDYAACNMTSDERIVSPFYKSKNGGMVRTPEDRFLGVVVKAEKAKLRRDVILDSTPGIIKAMFRDMCEQKLLDLVTPELIEQKIIPAFAEYGITREHLDKIVGRPLKLGWKEEDRLNLRKILAALKNEETTVAELLAGLDETTTTPPAGTNGGAKASDLTSPYGGAQQSSHPAGAQTPQQQTEPPKTDAGTKTDPPKTEPPVDPKAKWPEWQKQFDAITKLTDVVDLKSKLRSLEAKGADDEFELDRLADAAKERIRNKGK